MDAPTLRYYEDHAGEVAPRYEAVAGGVSSFFPFVFSRGERILEIGAGSGRDAARLLALGVEVDAVEPSAALRERALADHPELEGRLFHGFLPGGLPPDFKILDSADALDVAIQTRISEGYKARMTAGFCWKWSAPREDGTLVDDVTLPGFSRPWNAKPDAGQLSDTVPPASVWTYDERGAGQIGCVYTAQGFEFDYVGVVFGPDLVFRSGQGWVGEKSQSFDTVVKRSGEKFVKLVQNTYRVLLTRGLKGCLAGGLTDHLNRAEHREEQQPVHVEVFTLLSTNELFHRLGGVDHVQDSDAIVIAHIELARLELLLP